MDPDASLLAGREAIVDYDNASSLSQQEDAAERLREHFASLDDWLSKGGFLPGPWSHVTPKIMED